MKRLKMAVVILAAFICLFGISGTAYAKDKGETHSETRQDNKQQTDKGQQDQKRRPKDGKPQKTDEQKTDSQKIDGQKIDGQKIDGQNTDSQKADEQKTQEPQADNKQTDGQKSRKSDDKQVRKPQSKTAARAGAAKLRGAQNKKKPVTGKPVSVQKKKKASKPKTPKNQIISLKSEISVRRGVATLRGCLILKSAKRVNARMQLQLYKSGKWITVKSWNTKSGPRRTLLLKQSAVLKKGYKYRLCMTYTIENGKTIKVSRVVKY